MSHLSDDKDRLDMRKRAEAAWLAAELARIDRSLAENRTLAAEQQRQSAEAAKLGVMDFVTPGATVTAALGALVAAAPVLMGWLRC